MKIQPRLLLLAGLTLLGCLDTVIVLTQKEKLLSSNLAHRYRIEEYDALTGQRPLSRTQQTDSVLALLPARRFESLPSDWLRYTRNHQMAAQLKGQRFREVRGADRYLFVVRDFRVRDFLPHDSAWAACERCPDSNCVQYWLVQPKVLHKLTSLLDSLEHRGLDAEAIAVRHGYRHHALNYDGGGAKASRHRMGDAIDLEVGDLNRDGEKDELDKQIVLTLLDKHIIRNEGGVGRYPGTQSVHMDVRGHRARWDSYTPAKLSQK